MISEQILKKSTNGTQKTENHSQNPIMSKLQTKIKKRIQNRPQRVKKQIAQI